MSTANVAATAEHGRSVKLDDPVWDEARADRNTAIRDRLLQASSARHAPHELSDEEMLELFERLRLSFEANNPQVDPERELLAERRAEAERE